MPILRGTVSGSITSVAKNIPSRILSWTITNNTGGALVVSLAVIGDGNHTYVWTQSVGAGASYVSDVPILVAKNAQIVIYSAGVVDYYISIE